MSRRSKAVRTFRPRVTSAITAATLIALAGHACAVPKRRGLHLLGGYGALWAVWAGAAPWAGASASYCCTASSTFPWLA